MKIFISFGKFSKTEIFNINEIFFDTSNKVFKAFIETPQLKNSEIIIKALRRYILISDSQILIFSPLANAKNLAHLLFCADIYLIEDLITENLDSQIEGKIKRKNQSLTNSYFKKFFLRWKNSDVYIPNIDFYTFDSAIIMDIDDFFAFNNKITSRRNQLLQTFELFSEDYHKPCAIEIYNIYDISKLVEICMYQEKLFFKSYLSENSFVLHDKDTFLVHQAKEIMFLYNKIIQLMNFGNDPTVIVYKYKLQHLSASIGFS